MTAPWRGPDHFRKTQWIAACMASVGEAAWRREEYTFLSGGIGLSGTALSGRDQSKRDMLMYILPWEDDYNGAFVGPQALLYMCEGLFKFLPTHNIKVMVVDSFKVAKKLEEQRHAGEEFDMVVLSYHGSPDGKVDLTEKTAAPKLNWSMRDLAYNLAKATKDGGLVLMDSCYGARFAKNLQDELTKKRDPTWNALKGSSKGSSKIESIQIIGSDVLNYAGYALDFVDISHDGSLRMKDVSEIAMLQDRPQQQKDIFWHWARFHLPKLPAWLKFKEWDTGKYRTGFGLPSAWLGARGHEG